MRITDEVALDSAQEAAGQLRYEIEAAFSQGLPNTPMAGSTVRVISGNFITARPVGVLDGVDFKHSGLVRKVDVGGITRTLEFGAMVLVSPFGFSPTGEAFNLTMEEVATSIAIALQADKLIFLSEVPGVRARPLEPEGDDNPIDTELPLAAAEQLLASLPSAHQPTDTAFYLQHCVKACKAGVERSHIIPFATDGSLLLEVYVHDGIGTMVIDEKLEELREATADDVGGILQLIEPFEKDGTLVKRDRTEIERDVANYTIVEHDGVIFACAALYPYPEARPARWPRSPCRRKARARATARRFSSASNSAPAPWGWRASSCSRRAPCTGSSSAASCRPTPTGCPRRASASTTGTARAWCSSRSSPEAMFRILHLDHLVLRVRDLHAMLRFYTQVLGCTLERRQEELGLYQLRAGASLIDLVPVDGQLGREGGAAPGNEGRNLDHFCLRIDPFDGEALRAWLASRGAQPGEVVQRYGAEGDGPSIYLSDPEGNTVELKGPPRDPPG